MHLDLTPGERADALLLPDLLAALPQVPGAVVADKAHDTNNVLTTISLLRTEAVIPAKKNRTQSRSYDRNLYADRNKIERCFHRLKQARAFATRYEKTALSFLAVAQLLATLDWLR